MAASRNPTATARLSPAQSFSSAIIPGLGQFLAGRRGRGLLILGTTVVLGFIIHWAFLHQNVGKITAGTAATSWLWFPLMLFWMWNVLDARALRRGSVNTPRWWLQGP